MENPQLVAAVQKLAIAGEQAGFSVEEMIQLLDEGLTVEILLDLIWWRHQGRFRSHPAQIASAVAVLVQ